jgi:hypothetical protein
MARKILSGNASRKTKATQAAAKPKPKSKFRDDFDCARTKQFRRELLRQFTAREVLEFGDETLAILGEGQYLDALALAVGCNLGLRYGVDIYDIACQLMSAEEFYRTQP